jgi:hypothetical protein
MEKTNTYIKHFGKDVISPVEGLWSITMRPHAPKAEVLDEHWNPPPVKAE